MRADTDEIIYSSFAAATPSIVSRLSLATGEITNVTITPSIGHSAGATTYSNGQVCCGCLVVKVNPDSTVRMRQACMLKLVACSGGLCNMGRPS